MNFLILASAFLALVAPHKAAVTVNVDAKNGDVITGDHKFRVTVDSTDPVTQVEFYVGTELRDKDTSTPYEFTIDTLDVPDGDLALRFKAYTTTNASGEAKITVKVNNEVAKGAPYHIAKAQALLSDSKFSDAVSESRIALKADPNSNAARFVLARAYLGTGDIAKAQKYAEDAVDADSKDAQALDLLAGINLQAAFGTVATGTGNRKEALDTIRDAIKEAVESRRKVLDAEVDKAGQPSGANLIPWSDVVLRSGRYSLAVEPLQSAFEKDMSQTPIADRLAYAYLRLGRNTEAANVLNGLMKQGSPSAFSLAALAVVRAEASDLPGSDDAMKDALLADPDEPAVLCAQAFIALKFVRAQVGPNLTFSLFYDDGSGDPAARAQGRQTLQKLVAQLATARRSRTETQYYQEALNDKLGLFPEAEKAFRAAVFTEPTNYDAYIESANRALATTQTAKLADEDKQQALDYAQIMFNAALECRSDSAQALTGLSLIAAFNNKPEEAVKWGQASVASNPSYAAGFVALSLGYDLDATLASRTSTALRLKERTAIAAERDALENQARAADALSSKYRQAGHDMGVKAVALDKRLEGQQMVAPFTAWRYYSSGGRSPVLPQPK